MTPSPRGMTRWGTEAEWHFAMRPRDEGQGACYQNAEGVCEVMFLSAALSGSVASTHGSSMCRCLRPPRASLQKLHDHGVMKLSPLVGSWSVPQSHVYCACLGKSVKPAGPLTGLPCSVLGHQRVAFGKYRDVVGTPYSIFSSYEQSYAAERPVRWLVPFATVCRNTTDSAFHECGASLAASL